MKIYNLVIITVYTKTLPKQHVFPGFPVSYRDFY